MSDTEFWNNEANNSWSRESGPVPEYVVDRIQVFLRKSISALKELTGEELDTQSAFFADIASGSFNNKYYPNNRVPDIAIDYSLEMLKKNKSLNKVLAEVVSPLPLANNASDITTSFMLMRYLSDNQQIQLIREMVRVTRPGGLVFISDFPMKILPDEKSAIEVNTFDVWRINAQAKKIEDAYIPQDMWNSHIDHAPRQEDPLDERFADSIYFVKKWK